MVGPGVAGTSSAAKDVSYDERVYNADTDAVLDLIREVSAEASGGRRRSRAGRPIAGRRTRPRWHRLGARPPAGRRVKTLADDPGTPSRNPPASAASAAGPRCRAGRVEASAAGPLGADGRGAWGVRTTGGRRMMRACSASGGGCCWRTACVVRGGAARGGAGWRGVQRVRRWDGWHGVMRRGLAWRRVARVAWWGRRGWGGAEQGGVARPGVARGGAVRVAAYATSGDFWASLVGLLARRGRAGIVPGGAVGRGGGAAVRGVNGLGVRGWFCVRRRRRGRGWCRLGPSGPGGGRTSGRGGRGRRSAGGTRRTGSRGGGR
ncbi:hypothetical protein FB475_3125 [Kribbella jejuensis]|uniref:Uncharacterized protein n=1 Tax=Kribbella jejuensis TaxID=236068 RepID=A0A542EUD0_9ACTN|nr:hypothetical protein FB475_3125 [Kribbella jejuensis]